jgi:hypothetical protein
MQSRERTTGFEPATSTLARWCSSQLSYVRKKHSCAPKASNCSARYWDRTSDLFRVREARYRCANRAQRACKSAVEVGTGFEPAYTALQAAASPLGHPTVTTA